MGTSARKGQALAETALGMFAFALVLCALCGFVSYVASSLEMRRTLRARAGKSAMSSSGAAGSLVTRSDSRAVDMDAFAAGYVFGRDRVVVKEKVSLPPMGGEL